MAATMTTEPSVSPLSEAATQEIRRGMRVRRRSPFTGRSVEDRRATMGMPGRFPGRVVEVRHPGAVTLANEIVAGGRGVRDYLGPQLHSGRKGGELHYVPAIHRHFGNSARVDDLVGCDDGALEFDFLNLLMRAPDQQRDDDDRAHASPRAP